MGFSTSTFILSSLANALFLFQSPYNGVFDFNLGRSDEEVGKGLFFQSPYNGVFDFNKMTMTPRSKVDRSFNPRIMGFSTSTGPQRRRYCYPDLLSIPV